MVLLRASIAIVAIVIASSARAKDIDLRNQTDTDREYNVAFCARPSPGSTGLPGHMFVAFSSVTATGERTFVALGHTVGADVSPATAVWSYFGSPVDGLLKQEMYTAIEQQCLSARVNKSDFNRALALTENPLASLGLSAASDTVLQEYRLGAEDCMTFATGVAQVLVSRGLVVPDRGSAETPMDYLKRLIDAN
ncbi:MAG: hypothetical protein EOQ41_03040 [Mesorhizobium sp.]|uniref:hypothetical protein n=1 Tax=Mesorhizobium sp. TaxID=1871066 RepID=UPI000FE98940|nr:hypothetical protein [Mesorhizobium sp.]RWB35801.1 MAG: hypothetical protein EOQ41_03040 [Mesorhizobium sp.]